MRDLWNWIESKAFNPRDRDEKETWLRCFHQFLPQIWDIERHWNKPVKTNSSWYSDEMNHERELKLGALTLKPLRDSEIGFSYQINRNDDGFSIRLYYSRGCFQIDYDEKYIFEFSNNPNPDLNMNRITKENIENAIRNRLHHPAHHTHLKDEQGDDYYHHLRFGCATNNPFVLLYQMAFQITDYENPKKDCPMKEREICRISKVLYANKDKLEISSGILFKL